MNYLVFFSLALLVMTGRTVTREKRKDMMDL
uniref:Toxin alpha TX-SP n=1 Tax=Olivierus martensii TaxID=34649 RepID=Q95P86_OLIMR|nr:toxin alpha TX-SP [Mesobuthus martensii]AAL24436.1 venom peptide T-U [Mesobuthus martensii]